MAPTHCSFRRLAFSLLFTAGFVFPALGDDAGDPAAGKTYFGQNCALCHSDSANETKQGPSLVGVVGRKAGSLEGFSFTKALSGSGLTWDAPTLNKFLTDPTALVPNTNMIIKVTDATARQNVIAYLGTLKAAVNSNAASSSGSATGGSEPGDWQNAKPGNKYKIDLNHLPAPFATTSAGNGPKGAARPDGVMPQVPDGFKVELFASGMDNPRTVRIAPNGDIFVAETGPSRIRILRAADGASTPDTNQIFAQGEGLDHPFGIAFYPPGNNPKWIYLANHNNVVRIPYHSGDLVASGAPEVVVPRLYDGGGGHSTRDVAFSLDGKRMFISVGSGSNLADGMPKKSVEDAQAWEKDHGLGATWGNEENRADILVTDPEGKTPLHTFATGIRNGVGIAVNPDTGDLYTSTNERDGLGDDLVPDYVTRVKEGAFYGWPWYYMGNHEEPRKKGDRPDLAGKVTVPDVPVQAHSASLSMCFYTATSGVALFPPDYKGDAFAAFHGSWNRNTRTGYKVVRIFLKNGVPTGEYEDFLTGFVVDNRSVWGRPVGVACAHDGALLVTEDGGGTMWRISPASH